MKAEYKPQTADTAISLSNVRDPLATRVMSAILAGTPDAETPKPATGGTDCHVPWNGGTLNWTPNADGTWSVSGTAPGPSINCEGGPVPTEKPSVYTKRDTPGDPKSDLEKRIEEILDMYYPARTLKDDVSVHRPIAGTPEPGAPPAVGVPPQPSSGDD